MTGELGEAVYGLRPFPPEHLADYTDALRLAASDSWPASHADLMATPEIVVRLVDAVRHKRSRELAARQSGG